MQKINGVKFLQPEEINSMVAARLEVTRNLLTNKTTGVKREMFSALVRFDRLHSFSFDIDNNEYALLNYHIQRKKTDDQFEMSCKVRLIETKWPEKDGRKAHSSYLLQIYVNDDLRWEFNFSAKSTFVKAMLAGYKDGKLQEYKPIERIPGQFDEEEKVDLEEPDEAPASEEEEPEKLPL